MPDPRFHSLRGPFSIGQLADISGAEIRNHRGIDQVFTDVAPLDAAGPDNVSFLDNRRYADAFASSAAGACLVHPDIAGRAPKGMALLVIHDPYKAYAQIARAYYPLPEPVPGIAPTATVDGAAEIGEGSQIAPGAVIAAGAQIGQRCRISANAYIGENVVLGNDSVIGSGATVTYCIIGERVILHAGVRIGQDGFGFALGGNHMKVVQLGRVLIEDDVEIGANTTIDRGAGPDTVIGTGTKIDNLVQIAHNVRIGRGCIIVSQVGISGSTTIGDFVMIGGQAGLTGHLNIADGARIAAQSGVMRDVAAATEIGGSPAMPIRNWLRGVAAVDRLAKKRGGS
jgi:UDP-3-O-[3-hydroxymyristoyl] glucosamine N-acyltransferase